MSGHRKFLSGLIGMARIRLPVIRSSFQPENFKTQNFKPNKSYLRVALLESIAYPRLRVERLYRHSQVDLIDTSPSGLIDNPLSDLIVTSCK